MNLKRFGTARPSTGSGRIRRKRNPGHDRPATAVVYPLRRAAARPRRAARRSAQARPRVAAAAPPPMAVPVLTAKYVVQPGDTLHRIARRFGTTARLLATLNELHKPALLVPGEIILVPD